MHLSYFALHCITSIAPTLGVPLAQRGINLTDATRYLFAFGDSYTATEFWINGTRPSCTRNLMGNPAFPGVTTDNGINWVGEIITLAPSCTLLYNFAFVGATINDSVVSTLSASIPSFVNQVTDFEETAAKQPSWAPWTAKTAAFAVWFGVNDVANSYQDPNAAAVDNQDQIDYFNQLNILYNSGGRLFLLLGTPPVNRAPSELKGSAESRAALHDSIIRWNTNFNKMATIWQASHAGSTVRVIDTRSLFANILDHPVKYGAPNATCYDADGTSCLWWNSYHPGQAIQKAVGKEALTTLQDMGFWGSKGN